MFLVFKQNIQLWTAPNNMVVPFCLHAPRCEEKKEEIWLSPMTKAPTPTEMSKGQSDNTNNATKKFD